MTAHKYGGDLLIGRPSSFDRELDREKSQKKTQKVNNHTREITNATQTRLFWRALKVQTPIKCLLHKHTFALTQTKSLNCTNIYVDRTEQQHQQSKTSKPLDAEGLR